ncbi:uncharacterized protein J3D65DRAFT_639395 [Phyllosticta citribraziliensis]|uniref:N-acetylgalactosaminide beta-1,3-galactosyltransferase n=1 Tax=Phyllosticta citribraziliensis TaxID=989973 RepID=A0ABR1L663_9PEZI
MLMQRQQRGATVLVCLSLVSFVYILYNLAFPHLVGRYGVQRESLFLESTDRDVECHSGTAARGAGKDVLVIMKTGATEARKKVPVHFDTTFRCIPNYVIYSDLEESINNVAIHDALANFSEPIKATNQDFHFYYKQRKYRAEGQNVSDLVATTAGRDRAWNLDKWKFLPLLEKALAHSPQAKWFVFIEADTYLVWSNLLRWLEQFDPEKPLYIGGQNWMGDTKFAHGGTGYIVSRKALRMAVDEYTKSRERWDEQTASEAAGDCLLAKLFNSVGIGLTETWPITQGETPFSLDYTSRHLCYPVVTYHHMPPDWVRAMWKFEQIWFSQAVSTRCQQSAQTKRMLTTRVASRANRPSCATATSSITSWRRSLCKPSRTGTTSRATTRRWSCTRAGRTAVGRRASRAPTACSGTTTQPAARLEMSSSLVRMSRRRRLSKTCPGGCWIVLPSTSGRSNLARKVGSRHNASPSPARVTRTIDTAAVL